jgi:hypothetical protein
MRRRHDPRHCSGNPCHSGGRHDCQLVVRIDRRRPSHVHRRPLHAKKQTAKWERIQRSICTPICCDLRLSNSSTDATPYSCRSAVEPQAAINRFLGESNSDPRPFPIRTEVSPEQTEAARRLDGLVVSQHVDPQSQLHFAESRRPRRLARAPLRQEYGVPLCLLISRK